MGAHHRLKFFGDELPGETISCWLTAASVAEWCDALDEETKTFLSTLKGVWRVPIPDDLTDLDAIPGLRYAQTWRFIEEEHKVFMKKNYNCTRLLDLSIKLRMEGALVEEASPPVCEKVMAACTEAADAIYKWCSTPDSPLPKKYNFQMILRFAATWTALERDHKVFRFTNNKARDLLKISIQNRMEGLL